MAPHKSVKLPRVISLESALVGSEDCKCENEKSQGMELERSELTVAAAPL